MRSLFLVLVPTVALSLATFACSGSDPEGEIEDGTVTQTSQLVDEGRACSAINKCKPGLACVARVKGGDVGIKGVPAPCDDKSGCGGSTSSSGASGSTTSSSGSSGSSGWGSTSSTSGASGTSGWSSSTSSTSGASGTSGWSSSTSSTGSSGWSSSTSSSSGATPEVGVCITVR